MVQGIYSPGGYWACWWNFDKNKSEVCLIKITSYKKNTTGICI